MLNSLRRAVGIAAAITVATACSSNTSNLATPSQTTSQTAAQQRVLRGPFVSGPIVLQGTPHPMHLPLAWPRHHHRPQILFVADPSNNQVILYNPKTPNPTPKGYITNGVSSPLGLAVDKHSALYVANAGNDTITVYPYGKSSPSLTISSGLSSPYGITVDSIGDVFASNLGNNTVVGYKPGATSPFESIDFSALGQPVGVGSDANDNIWVACDTTNKVFEIPAGSSTPKDSGLLDVAGPIGVSFGQNDQIFVSNFSTAKIEVYNYGSTSPAYTITSGIVAPTLNGVTHSDFFFQSNQDTNVVGYQKGATTPFSTITGITNPLGIASSPLVTK